MYQYGGLGVQRCCCCCCAGDRHPYEGYLKTLEFGASEGKYYDLPGLGGDKYSECLYKSMFQSTLTHSLWLALSTV